MSTVTPIGKHIDAAKYNSGINVRRYNRGIALKVAAKLAESPRQPECPVEYADRWKLLAASRTLARMAYFAKGGAK